jgi:peptidoglycan-N-acetylglucosamine deacetylase
LLSANHDRPIFYDPRGRRAYLVAAFNWAGFTLLGILVTCLVATSIWGPTLPSLELTAAPRLLSSTGSPPPPSTGEPLLDPRNARVPPTAAGETAARYGYFVNWDDNSFSSLKRNAHALDVLIVEWLHLSGPTGSLTRSDPGKESLVRTWTATNAPQLKLYPLVNNYNSNEKRWDGVGTADMLASKTARATFVDEIYKYVIELPPPSGPTRMLV